MTQPCPWMRLRCYLPHSVLPMSELNLRAKISGTITGIFSYYWNVKPLIGDFGGRVRIYSFFTEPYYPMKAPLSLVVGSCSLFATSTVCVHACRPKSLPEGLQLVQAHGWSAKKYSCSWTCHSSPVHAKHPIRYINFSPNCMQNDVTLVHFFLISFRKKHNGILLRINHINVWGCKQYWSEMGV